MPQEVILRYLYNDVITTEGQQLSKLFLCQPAYLRVCVVSRFRLETYNEGSITRTRVLRCEIKLTLLPITSWSTVQKTVLLYERVTSCFKLY